MNLQIGDKVVGIDKQGGEHIGTISKIKIQQGCCEADDKAKYHLEEHPGFRFDTEEITKL